MKSLIIFYSVCLLLFYSLLTYIGNRNKKNSNPQSTGLLEDVTVPSSDYKVTKAKLLSRNFDNAIVYTKMQEPKKASEEIYNAIMLLAINNTSREKYVQVTLSELLKDLSICYVSLERKQPVPVNMSKIFESSELFIAYGYMNRARKELKRNDIVSALENITKAEECLAISARYAEDNELKTHAKLVDHTKQLLDEIVIIDN